MENQKCLCITEIVKLLNNAFDFKRGRINHIYNSDNNHVVVLVDRQCICYLINHQAKVIQLTHQQRYYTEDNITLKQMMAILF